MAINPSVTLIFTAVSPAIWIGAHRDAHSDSKVRLVLLIVEIPQAALPPLTQSLTLSLACIFFYIYKNLQLTLDELVENKWLKNPQESPYYAHLDEIIHSSSKVDDLQNIINNLQFTKSGAPESLIVISNFSLIVLILFLLISSCDQSPSPAALSKSPRTNHFIVVATKRILSTKEPSSDVRSQFERSTEQHQPLSESRWVFISLENTEVCGVGVTCTRAGTLVHMECDYMKFREKQAEAQIHRISQSRSVVHAYRLLSSNSDSE